MSLKNSAFILLISLAFTACGFGKKSSDATLLELNIVSPYNDIFVGDTVSVVATALFSDSHQQDVTESVTWSSDDETILKAEKAELTAVNEGHVTVFAQYNEKKTEKIFFVHLPPKGLTISAETVAIEQGQVLPIKVAFVHSDDSQTSANPYITWSISDEKIAIISVDGRLTAIGYGDVVVTAKYRDISAELTIKITPKIKKITISGERSVIEVNDATPLTIQTQLEDDSVIKYTTGVNWQLSNKLVAYIDSDNVLHGMNPGTTLISANIKNVVATYEVTVEKEFAIYATKDTIGGIELTWPDKKADYYNLYWDTQANVTKSSNSQSVIKTTSTTFQPVKLLPGDNYYFRLSKVVDGIESDLSRVTQVTVRNNSWRNQLRQQITRADAYTAITGKNAVIIGGYTETIVGGKIIQKDRNEIETVDLEYLTTNSKVTSMTIPRDAATCNDGALLYIVGGKISSTIQTKIYRFSGVTNDYQILAAELATAVANSSCVFWQNTIDKYKYLIIVGGTNSSDKAITTVLKYNIDTGTETTLPQLPNPLARTRSFIYGNKVFVFGGRSDSDSVDTIYSLDLSKIDTTTPPDWTIEGTMPLKLDSFQIALGLENKLIVAGGVSTVSGVETFNFDVFEFDFANSSFRTLVRQRSRRTDFGLVSYQNKIFFLNGTIRNTTSAQAEYGEYYDLSSNKWFPQGLMPFEATDFTLSKSGTNIYLIGGSVPVANSGTANLTEVTANVWRYDTIDENWQKVAAMNTPRRYAAAAEINGFIYVFGGDNDTGLLKTTEKYDVAANAWTTLDVKFDFGWTNLIALVANDKILLIGGEVATEKATQIFEEFDPETNKFRILANPPFVRKNFASVVDGDYLYVVGGSSELGKVSNSTYRYHTKAELWSSDLATIAVARKNAVLHSINGHLIVTAGESDNINDPPIVYTEIHDAKTNTFTKGPALPSQRNPAKSVTVNNAIYVFGGVKNVESRTVYNDSIDILD